MLFFLHSFLLECCALGPGTRGQGAPGRAMSRPSTGARGLTAQGGAPPTASRAPTAGRVGSRAGSGRVRRRGLASPPGMVPVREEGGHHPQPTDRALAREALLPAARTLCSPRGPPLPRRSPAGPAPPGPQAGGERAAMLRGRPAASRSPRLEPGEDWPGLGCKGKKGDRGGWREPRSPAPCPPCPWAGALTDRPGATWANRGPPRRGRRWRRSRRR